VEQFTNNSTTTLAANITDTTGTSITVASSAGFPSTGTFRVIIDSELMKVTNVSGVTWTVSRGNGGSTPATHSAGATVTQLLTAEALNAAVSIQQSGTEESNRRVLNFIGASVADNPGQSRADITIAGAAYGAAASRPSAGQSGRIYIPSDGLIVSVDTGTQWIGLNPFGASFTIPPTLSNWTSFNATYMATTDIPGGGINVRSTSVAMLDYISGIVRTLSNGSSYSIVTAISLLQSNSSYPDFGLCISDGTKFIAFSVANRGTIAAPYLAIYQFNSATSFSASAQTGQPVNYVGPVLWLKITNDGTHRTYYASIDGVAWAQVYQEASATFLTETQAGIHICVDVGNAAGTILNTGNFLHWAGA
jgi:hypothetical protein